jgi:protein-disulfide isomerase
MPSFRRSILIAAAAPLALALAACDGEAGPPTGGPIAPIAAPAGQNWVDMAAETPEGGFVIGNPDAPLKLVEYASHTCSHCAAFAQEGGPEVEKLVAKGIVSYEIRNQLHDPIDMTIALLARCSGDPARFHPLANQWWGDFQNVMSRVQTNGAALERANQAPQSKRLQAIAEAAGVLDFFTARGLTREQAMACLADIPKAQAIADASERQSEELGVTGTPFFLLNGRPVEGTTWGPIQDTPGIEAALKAAGAR